MGIAKAVIEVDLAELTAIQQGLAALKVSADMAVQSIERQLTVQLEAAQRQAAVEARKKRKVARANSHASPEPAAGGAPS
jgi:hypothetical protein